MNDGLKYAYCALSFFRGRHELKRRYRKARGRRRQELTSQYERSVYMARHYIGLARAAGFRGSVLKGCQEGKP